MSRAKNVVNVLKERLKTPLDTTREIAKKIGIDHSTVARIDKQLPQIATKSEQILKICESDLKAIELGQAEINRRLSDEKEKEKMRTVEISQVIRENTARYTIFKGDISDAEGGLKEITIDM